MLTYENFVSILLSTIERAGLNISYTQELLDTHALGRSLSITCLPDGVADDQSPQEPALRAVVMFRWSPEFTVFSLRGSASLDNIERFVDERLYAQARGGPSMEVELTYHLPLSAEQQRDVAGLPVIARVVQDLHGTIAAADQMVRVDSQLTFQPGRSPRIAGVSAIRTWSIDEALYDPDLLADTFEELCSELRAMLELLAAHYAISREDPDSAPGDMPGERRYYKPPTA